MPRQSPDWASRLADAFAERTGVGEEVLAGATAGGHTPYSWLARAVSARAASVVDLACGSGRLVRELEQPGRHVVGVDWRPAELEVARGRGAGEFVCADVRALPFPDASFDVVTSALGLAVVHPTDQFVAEAARVLKPGGVLVLMAPALYPMGGHDVWTLARLTALLRSRPRLPGVAHRAEFELALGMHRLRRVEVRRECYRFRVESRADAERIVHGLYVPARGRARRDQAVAHLLRRIDDDGALDIAIPLRRVVAIK